MSLRDASLKKLNDIREWIQKNSESLDFPKLLELLTKLEEEIRFCIVLNPRILDFLRNKSNFKTLPELKKFSEQIISYTPKKKNRVEVEEEIAKIISSKNLSLEAIQSTFEKSSIKPQKPSAPKKKASTSAQKVKIEDQTARWMNLTREQLANELNDLTKYPDIPTLKQASLSLLKAEDKKLRAREKVINVILKRIAEDQAIASFGR